MNKLYPLLLLLIPVMLAGDTIADLPLPRGYTRVTYPPASYSGWLRKLPLKKDNTIMTHKGQQLSNRFYNIFTVVDLPLLYTSDLEQCADYAMRLWVEYHKAHKKENQLYLFNYNGSKKQFAGSGQDLNTFLRLAMAYSNSYSLKTGCSTVSAEKLLIPGDMLVQNQTGGIGHVSIILDICENAKGERLYLIGYSFMPAQELHIEKASLRYGKSGWFTYKGYLRYLEEVLPFGEAVLRRFE